MARNNSTPVTFFLSCTLPELSAWVQANNDLVRDEKNRSKKALKR